MICADSSAEYLVLPVRIGGTQFSRQFITPQLSGISTIFISTQHIIPFLSLGEGYGTIIVYTRSLSVLSFLSSDNDHTIGCTRTVDSSCGGVFQYCKGFNISRIDHRQSVCHTFDTFVINSQTVNDNQRVVTCIQRGTATNSDLCSTSRCTVI